MSPEDVRAWSKVLEKADRYEYENRHEVREIDRNEELESIPVGTHVFLGIEGHDLDFAGDGWVEESEIDAVLSEVLREGTEAVVIEVEGCNGLVGKTAVLLRSRGRWRYSNCCDLSVQTPVRFFMTQVEAWESFVSWDVDYHRFRHEAFVLLREKIGGHLREGE